MTGTDRAIRPRHQDLLWKDCNLYQTDATYKHTETGQYPIDLPEPRRKTMSETHKDADSKDSKNDPEANADSHSLEVKLSEALEDVERYKSKLEVTNSLLEEAEELLEFTWEQVESAEEQVRERADAKQRAEELEREKARLEEQARELKQELSKTTDSIRQMQDVADVAEERAYQAEQELYLSEHGEKVERPCGRRAFFQVLELAVRKAQRYDRGLAILVFPRLDEEGEMERVLHLLRDSDLLGLLDESTFGVILEEDLPYHDIGEAIERLSERLARPYGSSFFGTDATQPAELVNMAQEALEVFPSPPRS